MYEQIYIYMYISVYIYICIQFPWEEWSPVGGGWSGCRWEGFELGEDPFGRGPALGMMEMI